MFSLLLASVFGFTHAFEVDHLLAVSSIVTRRKTLYESLRDGVYWGLGHSSTILIVGFLMIIAKWAISEAIFGQLEMLVGLMLIGLGIQRLWKAWTLERRHVNHHALGHAHDHRLAYGVGLVHGLAGSGAVVLLAMTQLKNNWQEFFFLVLFGVGSIFGMLLASGIFSLPFSQKLQRGKTAFWLMVLSSALCIWFGGKIIWTNAMNL